MKETSVYTQRDDCKHDCGTQKTPLGVSCFRCGKLLERQKCIEKEAISKEAKSTDT